MEKMIRKLAKAVDSIAGKVGGIESKIKAEYEKKTPKSVKNFINDPKIIFDNYNKKISVQEIKKFLETKGKDVAFSDVLELIVKLKLDNIFETKKFKKINANAVNFSAVL